MRTSVQGYDYPKQGRRAHTSSHRHAQRFVTNASDERNGFSKVPICIHSVVLCSRINQEEEKMNRPVTTHVATATLSPTLSKASSARFAKQSRGRKDHPQAENRTRQSRQAPSSKYSMNKMPTNSNFFLFFFFDDLPAYHGDKAVVGVVVGGGGVVDRCKKGSRRIDIFFVVFLFLFFLPLPSP